VNVLVNMVGDLDILGAQIVHKVVDGRGEAAYSSASGLIVSSTTS